MKALQFVLAVSLAVCGPSFAQPHTAEAPLEKYGAADAERIIRDRMKDQHVTLRSVTCPADTDFSEGHFTKCLATDDEGTTSEFTIKTENRDLVWNSEKSITHLEHLGASLSEQLSSSLGKVVQAECPQKAVFKRDNCAITCKGTVDGVPSEFHGTCGPNGIMNFETKTPHQ
jgi:hypothetical protein